MAQDITLTYVNPYVPTPLGKDAWRNIPSPIYVVIGVHDLEEPRPEAIQIEDLYPAPEYRTVELSTAMKLLADCLTHIEAASKLLASGELVASDDQVQQMQGLLPELFCCRKIGEGYGQVINAIMSAFENLKGIALNEKQLATLKMAIQRVREEPYMKQDSSGEIIEDLENSGLGVTPPEFDALTDLLDEQSLR
jgi:hypothetical protein